MVLRLVGGESAVLRQETRDFDQSETSDARSLAHDMFGVLDTIGGIGLAAPQVGVDRSLFVISIDGMRKVFINPAVLSTGDTLMTEEEGCLSLPGLRLNISRPTEITVAWLDEDGNQQVADMKGLWARCWLHEYDHLKGILIEDRVSRLALDIARRKLAKKARLNRR